jgi:hypothetical protein
MTIDIDFCKVSAGMNNPFVDIALAGLRASMGAMLHECPYNVSWVWKVVQKSFL